MTCAEFAEAFAHTPPEVVENYTRNIGVLVLSFMACSSILIQRKFSIDVGEPSLKNTYTQFRQWLKDRYGGEMSEDDKKIAVANVDEEIQEKHCEP